MSSNGRYLAGDANYIIENNARHVWHPMADPNVSSTNPPVIINKSDGVYVYDLKGKGYLDCTASLWNVNVGHNRPEVKQAIISQLDQLAYYNTFGNATNAPSIALSTMLTGMLATENMKRVIFSSGGSDAIETARFCTS